MAEFGASAVFVSAWSAIGDYVNLVLGKQYECNQTDFYIPAGAVCQGDSEIGAASAVGLTVRRGIDGGPEEFAFGFEPVTAEVPASAEDGGDRVGDKRCLFFREHAESGVVK